MTQIISTHALTWRATLILARPDLLGQGISTHALTWRATRLGSIRGCFHGDFYPRPHMEGDA